MSDKWLTYDQVSLIPTVVSELKHRAEANTNVKFGPITLGIPLIAAPMPDVSNGEMAKKLWELGSFGWIHRFQSDEDIDREFLLASGKPNPTWLGLAIPANAEAALAIVRRRIGCQIFCIDTANGANQMVERTIKTLKDKFPGIFLVTGNVASAEAFLKLESWGADAIRVGIAGGSVCETRTETGVYSPMATVIQQCATRVRTIYQPVGSGGPIDVLDQYKRALLIADGGIKTPADMCKALALGADLVMAGNIFAGSKEAPGDPINTGTHEKPQLVKLMRGAASFSVQNGKSEYIEGRESFVPYKGSVERVVNRFAAGLRSSMSYMNSRTLEEYRRNVKIVECS